MLEKLNDANCETRLRFVNWHLYGVHAEKVDSTLVLLVKLWSFFPSQLVLELQE